MRRKYKRGSELRIGFTLVELVVTALVFSILAAIAIPKVTQSLASRRLQAASNRIAADFAYARAKAKNQGKSVEIQFVVGGSTYSMPSISSPNRDPAYTVDLQQTPYPVTISAADFGGDNSVFFDLYGHADSAGTVTISDGGQTRVLQLAQHSGQLNLQP